MVKKKRNFVKKNIMDDNSRTIKKNLFGNASKADTPDKTSSTSNTQHQMKDGRDQTSIKDTVENYH